jgi:hypothetical protein
VVVAVVVGEEVGVDDIDVVAVLVGVVCWHSANVPSRNESKALFSTPTISLQLGNTRKYPPATH